MIPPDHLPRPVAVDHLAGRIAVRGTTVPTAHIPEIGRKALPALGFTFWLPDQVTLVTDEVLLVLDPTTMRDVRAMVAGAVDRAITSARRKQ